MYHKLIVYILIQNSILFTIKSQHEIIETLHCFLIENKLRFFPKLKQQKIEHLQELKLNF